MRLLRWWLCPTPCPTTEMQAVCYVIGVPHAPPVLLIEVQSIVFCAVTGVDLCYHFNQIKILVIKLIKI